MKNLPVGFIVIHNKHMTAEQRRVLFAKVNIDFSGAFFCGNREVEGGALTYGTLHADGAAHEFCEALADG